MVNEAEIFSIFCDDDLTDRQRWLKYEYWAKRKALDRLINDKKLIDNKIEKLKIELDLL